jgi:hypothetical protein
MPIKLDAFTPKCLQALLAIGASRCRGDLTDPAARRWAVRFCRWSILLELSVLSGFAETMKGGRLPFFVRRSDLAYGTTPPGRAALRKLRSLELIVRTPDRFYGPVQGPAYQKAILAAWRWLCRNTFPLTEADRRELRARGFGPELDS